MLKDKKAEKKILDGILEIEAAKPGEQSEKHLIKQLASLIFFTVLAGEAGIRMEDITAKMIIDSHKKPTGLG